MNTRRVYNDFHQAEVWIARNGRVLRLAEMDPNHRRNLLIWMRGNAQRLKEREYFSLIFGPRPGPYDSDSVNDAFDEMLHQLERTPAREWLEAQRLVAHLRELVEGDAPTRRRRALAMPMPAGAIRSWS